MTIQKHYLNHSWKELGISRFRLIAGIVAGLFTSIALYGFLYMMRETFRLFSISGEYDIWVLSDAEVNFYNLFFALLAVVYGHSLCISYWLDTPRRLKDKIFRRRNSIVNDQRVFNWFFIQWFFRVATLIGFLYCFSFRGWHYIYKLYPKYNYMLILIVVVLYLNTWNSTRLLFKNKSVRWLLVSIFITVSLSFSISRINFINYRELNGLVLNKCVYVKYRLEVPRSQYYTRLENLSLIGNLYIAKSKSGLKESKYVVWADGVEIEMVDVRRKIEEWREMRDISDRPKITVKLSIHSGTPMKYVTELKEELMKCGQHKIAYAVAPEGSEIDPRYFRNHSVRSKLAFRRHPFFDSIEYANSLNRIENQIKLSHSGEKDLILINGKLVHYDTLVENLKSNIKRNTDYIIKYHFSDSLDFGTYIKVISSTKVAIQELREEYSVEKFLKELNALEYEMRREAEGAYFYRYLDIPEHDN